MSSFRLGRFLRPEVLASVQSTLLRKFLSPYESYFQSREFHLAHLDEGADAEKLVQLSSILLNPSTEIPHELVDALFCIHEVAIEANTDLLEMTILSEKVEHEEDGQPGGPETCCRWLLNLSLTSSRR